MKNKKILKKTLSILLILLVLLPPSYLIYRYAVEREFAIKKVKEHMFIQGTAWDNIESIDSGLNWMKGGYEIRIQLKDDPDHEYNYGYILLDSGLKYVNKAHGSVYKKDSNGASSQSFDSKYPPLDGWR